MGGAESEGFDGGSKGGSDGGLDGGVDDGLDGPPPQPVKAVIKSKIIIRTTLYFFIIFRDAPLDIFESFL